LLQIFFDPLSQRGGAGFAPPLPLFHLKQKRPVLHSSIIASAFLEPIKPFSHREAGFPAARFRFCFSFGSLESRFSENNRKGQRKGLRKGLRKGQKSVAFFLLLWYSKD